MATADRAAAAIHHDLATLIRDVLEAQTAPAAALVDDARNLTAAARRHREQHIRERHAMTGLAISMLAVAHQPDQPPVPLQALGRGGIPSSAYAARPASRSLAA
jgi:hypothetical protein